MPRFYSVKPLPALLLHADNPIHRTDIDRALHFQDIQEEVGIAPDVWKNNLFATEDQSRIWLELVDPDDVLHFIEVYRHPNNEHLMTAHCAWPFISQHY